MRLLGKRSTRWRRSRVLPYLLAAIAGIAGGVAKWWLKNASSHGQIESFWAQLGIELLFWLLVSVVYLLIVLAVYLPQAKRTIGKRRQR